jgi:hypothetical protein
MTTNYDLQNMADVLGIKNFRGVICRDEFKTLLPALENETGIYNFNDSSKPGSHWASWCKRGNNWYHFCSYGSDPCLELKEYHMNERKENIMSHTYRLQDWDETSCGEWCILFCYLISNPKLAYEDVILFFFEEKVDNKCHSEDKKKQ